MCPLLCLDVDPTQELLALFVFAVWEKVFPRYQLSHQCVVEEPALLERHQQLEILVAVMLAAAMFAQHLKQRADHPEEPVVQTG